MANSVSYKKSWPIVYHTPNTDFEKHCFLNHLAKAFGCKNSLQKVSAGFPVNDPSTPPAPRVQKKWANSPKNMWDDIGRLWSSSGFGVWICLNIWSHQPDRVWTSKADATSGYNQQALLLLYSRGTHTYGTRIHIDTHTMQRILIHVQTHKYTTLHHSTLHCITLHVITHAQKCILV